MKIYQTVKIQLPKTNPEGVHKPIEHTEFRDSVLANFDGLTIMEGQHLRFAESGGLIHDPVFIYEVLVEGDEDETLLLDIAGDAARKLGQESILFTDTYGNTFISEVANNDL